MSEQAKKQKKENIVAGLVGAFLGSVIANIVLGQLAYIAALSGIV